MTATSDMLDPTPLGSTGLRTGRRAIESDVEVLARRALGIAMNVLADGAHTPSLPDAEPEVVERAKLLLTSRVPSGPELALALELLDDAVAVPIRPIR